MYSHSDDYFFWVEWLVEKRFSCWVVFLCCSRIDRRKWKKFTMAKKLIFSALVIFLGVYIYNFLYSQPPLPKIEDVVWKQSKNLNDDGITPFSINVPQQVRAALIFCRVSFKFFFCWTDENLCHSQGVEGRPTLIFVDKIMLKKLDIIFLEQK